MSNGKIIQSTLFISDSRNNITNTTDTSAGRVKFAPLRVAPFTVTTPETSGHNSAVTRRHTQVQLRLDKQTAVYTTGDNCSCERVDS